MSTQTHLETLKLKHKLLDANLADELLQASSGDHELAEIKHEKLKPKDEIVALEAKLRSTASA